MEEVPRKEQRLNVTKAVPTDPFPQVQVLESKYQIFFAQIVNFGRKFYHFPPFSLRINQLGLFT